MVGTVQQRIPLRNVAFQGPGTITAVVPPGLPLGFQNVTVTNPDTQTDTLVGGFRVALSLNCPCPVAYDVYLDTVDPPATLVCAGTPNTTCQAGPLEPSTTYFWKVVAVNPAGSTPGPVWSFSTAMSPSP